MVFSNDRKSIDVIAMALLVEALCARTAFDDSGPQFLVFETNDARKSWRQVNVSGNAHIIFKAGETEKCDEKHETKFRHSSAHCPVFRKQAERLVGQVVAAAKTENRDLLLTFESGDRLIVSGEVQDSDAEGWSLFGNLTIGISPDVLDGTLYGSIPDLLRPLLKDEHWGDAEL